MIVIDLVRIDFALDEFLPVPMSAFENVLDELDVLVPFPDNGNETLVASSKFVVLREGLKFSIDSELVGGRASLTVNQSL